MGRGNVCTYGDYEGLFYVDWNYFLIHFYDDENGCETDEVDYDQMNDCMEDDLVGNFPALFMKRFSSFVRCDKWIDRGECRAIMESPLFYVCLQDNEWSMAVELIQRETYDDRLSSLQKRHYHTYLDGIRDCLFELFPELGVRNGPWMHKVVRREDFLKKKEAV